MSKRQILMILGLLIIIVTFLGFPWGVKEFFIIVGGALVAVIAYSMAPKVKPTRESDVPFTEYKSAITNQPTSDTK